MAAWRIEATERGLRLAPVRRRALAAEAFTWADLLHVELTAAQVYVLCFPSRFDLPVDTAAGEALRAFGTATGAGTTVAFWDPTDPEFSTALAFFDLAAPPALVLARGRAMPGRRAARLAPADLYAITLTDAAVLGDRARLAAAVNSAHEVLVRADPAEIAGYLRERSARSVLAAIGRVAARLREEVLAFKPSFQLPGGGGISLG